MEKATLSTDHDHWPLRISQSLTPAGMVGFSGTPLAVGFLHSCWRTHCGPHALRCTHASLETLGGASAIHFVPLTMGERSDATATTALLSVLARCEFRSL